MGLFARCRMAGIKGQVDAPTPLGRNSSRLLESRKSAAVQHHDCFDLTFTGYGGNPNRFQAGAKEAFFVLSWDDDREPGVVTWSAPYGAQTAMSHSHDA